MCVKFVGQGHRAEFTATVSGGMHVTVGDCACTGDLWRMELNSVVKVKDGYGRGSGPPALAWASLL